MPAFHPFTERDLQQLRDHGIDPGLAVEQLAALTAGMPRARLDRPCTRGDGILVLDGAEFERLGRRGEAAARDGRCLKFVPASGVATRLFQVLSPAATDTAAVRDLREPPALREFMERLEEFAFHPELEAKLKDGGAHVHATGRFDAIRHCLLETPGLGYARLPKALIPFHRHPDGVRTPVAEHLMEARAYACDRRGTARIHFTVSPEHRAAMERHIAGACRRHQGRDTHFEVTLSEQRPATDTLAATPDNQPFREPDGSLWLRPGGHGALLANLNEVGGDIVFIQNIDNVSAHPGTAIRCRKALAGLLVELQARVFDYLRRLGPDAAPSLVKEAADFARASLSVVPPAALARAPMARRVRFLRETLNRPLRVCGMVPAAGEPGGGPFWVRGSDGAGSLQIVESSQVDMTDPRQRAVLGAATHFNPADLVCGLRDHSGAGFDLMRFRDPSAAFVSVKSSRGRPLKALEHPGLWNGGMARWNTVFVELPADTFAPVKSVLDLLRPEHRTD